MVRALIATSYQNDVKEIILQAMLVVDKSLYNKSIYGNYEESKRKINTVISKWNKKGMKVRIMGQHSQMRDSVGACYFVDNLLAFSPEFRNIIVCCGNIEMPIEIMDYTIEKYWNSFPFRYFRYLHFCSKQEDLPLACQTCYIKYLKKYSDTCADSIPKNILQEAYSLYVSASKLKKSLMFEESEKLFHKALNLKPDFSLRGKIYFHLGEKK